MAFLTYWLYYQTWDKKLLSAFNKIQDVNQPLFKFITEDLWDKCCRIAGGKEEMDSVLNCYYKEPVE